MIKAKKSLGQNFLIDQNILKKIVNITEIKNKTVLEVGPGTGNLTHHILLKKPKKVYVIEKDEDLAIKLFNNFKDKIEIINEDILLINEKNLDNDKFIVFGNLPYNISTEILSKWIINLKDFFWFECLVLMFQKEVAQRIISKPNSKEYGIISVKTQLLYDVKILFDVSPNVFFPKPRVNSSVISMTRKKNININFDLKLFDRLVKLSFQQRRKKIKNSLKKLDIKENILEDTIFGLRPEQLSVNDFIRLTQKISNETI